MNRGDISGFLRQIGLLYPLDFVRFYMRKLSMLSRNKDFKKRFPDVALPPDYLMYESFNLDYEKYFLDGKETAEWLAGHLRKHVDLTGLRILDWGCGPGRIVRHLPEVIGNNCTFFGTDYNEKSIDWCQKNIPNVQFRKNEIEPPTAFDDNFFDVIYGVSIFTHLSEKSHHSWIEELVRITKPGGRLLLTTHGDAFKHKLSRSELVQYEAGALVVRGKVKEGHRVFTTFHPPLFMQAFFQHFTNEIECFLGKYINGKPEQDVWIIQLPD